MVFFRLNTKPPHKVLETDVAGKIYILYSLINNQIFYIPYLLILNSEHNELSTELSTKRMQEEYKACGNTYESKIKKTYIFVSKSVMEEIKRPLK